jgi:outer membrane protein assembly factor BamB
MRNRWYLLLLIGSVVGAVSTVVLWMSPAEPLPSSFPSSETGLPDWPHLRGPKYDAISTETGLADAWPADGPPVLWRRDLGQGYSGFVVVGGRVFTQMQTLAGQFVVCLDAETGAERWRYRYGWPWQPAGRYPGPYATPTWNVGRVYFSGPDGLVGCLDAETGRSVWSVNVLRRFTGRGAEFGYACTPLVEDGKVILPVGGPGASLVALDATDGSTAWQSGPVMRPPCRSPSRAGVGCSPSCATAWWRSI